jgi:aquaporin Z
MRKDGGMIDRGLKAFAAELIGTMVLMLAGPGSAVLAGGRIGAAGVAASFGLALMVLAFALGPISGCHVNPAVTVGMWLSRRIKGDDAIVYVIAQLCGAFLGGLVIWLIAKSHVGFDATNNFAANGWGRFSPGGYRIAGAIVVEIVFTAVLVFVALATGHRAFPKGLGPVALGGALTLIHLVTIPIDNTSVNPARSFGAAVFAGSDALRQLWVFLVFPVVGAVVGLLAWLAVDDSKLEDTVLGRSEVLVEARDRATTVVHKAADVAGDTLD